MDVGAYNTNRGFAVRSRHFIFGMPELTDLRHNYTPEGIGAEQYWSERPSCSGTSTG